MVKEVWRSYCQMVPLVEKSDPTAKRDSQALDKRLQLCNIVGSLLIYESVNNWDVETVCGSPFVSST